MSELKRYDVVNVSSMGLHVSVKRQDDKGRFYLCSDVDKRNAELEGLLNDAANVMFDVYFANGIEHVGHGKLREVGIKIRKALEKVSNELEAQVNRECIWSQEFTQHETRKTSCGAIYNGIPNIKYTPYCSFCGGKIKEVK